MAVSGIAPLNPIDILTLRERLRWPCDDETAVHVLMAMDDTYCQIQREDQQDQQSQAA